MRLNGLMEIGEVHVLQRQERRDEAQSLIAQVASYVKPLMRKHRLKVGKLVEFFPSNKNLYGTNYGKGICVSLRLRYAHDKNSFLDFENVLDVMLHELAHNTVGPHNKRFFSVYESYKSEMYSMRAKGFRGDLFTGEGRVLGGRPRPPAPPLSRIVKGRGRRLGGRNQAGDLRSILADAAEKRREADRICAPVDFADMGIEEITAEEFFRRPKAWDATGVSKSASPEKEVPVIDLTKELHFVDLT